MTAIIDYDAGNMGSVEKALISLGETPVLTRDPQKILQADHLILPGVGAFGDAMKKLEDYGLVEVIREAAGRGIPLLGICLGMQVLFESSEEAPGVQGLGLLKGKIVRFPSEPGLKVPHMGWNDLHYVNPGKMFDGIPEHSYVYFVHSYYLQAEREADVTASAVYGSTTLHASVESGSLFGCQFHPEKSSETGLRMLHNFVHV